MEVRANVRRRVSRTTRIRQGQGGGPKKHEPRARGNHRKIYAAGDIIPESGIYEVIHENQHRATHESVMVKGDAFPYCDTCDKRVRFRVVRTAPYIFHDDDFAE